MQGCSSSKMFPGVPLKCIPGNTFSPKTHVSAEIKLRGRLSITFADPGCTAVI
jgi:hypothetical protein